MKATPEQQKAVDGISRFLTLVFPSNPIVELRVRCANGSWRSGCYTDYDQLARTAIYLEAYHDLRALYYSANPIKPEAVPSIGGNAIGKFCRMRVKYPRCAGNNHIERRLIYYLDCDPVRQPGVMASDTEKAAAFELALKATAYLNSQGWPTPVIVDSGSGFQCLFLGDGCPVDEEHTAVWKHCIEFLAGQFDTEAAHIDQCVYNPGRIARLPYSWNKKGESIEDRPHRQAHVVSYPEELIAISDADVHRFAQDHGFDPSTVKSRVRSGCNATADDMTTFIDDCAEDHDFVLDVTEIEHRGADTYYHLGECPFEGYAHPGSDRKTSLMVVDGVPGFKCWADQCTDKSFGDLLDEIEKESGSRPWFRRLTEDDFAVWGISLDDPDDDPEQSQPAPAEQSSDEPEPATVATASESVMQTELEPVTREAPASTYIPLSLIESLRRGLQMHPAARATDWNQHSLTSHPADWGLAFGDVKDLYSAAAFCDINKLPSESQANGFAVMENILHRRDLKVMGARLGHRWLATLAIRKGEQQIQPKEPERPMTPAEFQAICAMTPEELWAGCAV